MINRIYTTEDGTFILVDKIASVIRHGIGYTVVMDNTHISTEYRRKMVKTLNKCL